MATTKKAAAKNTSRANKKATAGTARRATAAKAAVAKRSREISMTECAECPKDKRTGKASGLQDTQTLCAVCEGSGMVPAPKKRTAEKSE